MVADEAPQGQERQSMDHRRERIRIETERYRIEGFLTLARDGYRSRVSDLLNASERDFLTLTDVAVDEIGRGVEDVVRLHHPGRAKTLHPVRRAGHWYLNERSKSVG